MFQRPIQIILSRSVVLKYLLRIFVTQNFHMTVQGVGQWQLARSTSRSRMFERYLYSGFMFKVIFFTAKMKLMLITKRGRPKGLEPRGRKRCSYPVLNYQTVKKLP